MTMFDWFAKKPATPTAAINTDSSGLGSDDATVPVNLPATAARHSPPGTAVNRKNERLLRREWLYAVVRESMTRAGVLSSGYKFKVLSLDSRGQQFLVMMDLSRQYVADTARMAEMEGHIAKTAKMRHDIVVTAVYWRVNDYVTAGLSKPSTLPMSAHPVNAAPAARPEPLQGMDEANTFKQTVASTPVATTTLSAPGEIFQPERRKPTPSPVFADTQLDDRRSQLSGTQYGELS